MTGMPHRGSGAVVDPVPIVQVLRLADGTCLAERTPQVRGEVLGPDQLAEVVAAIRRFLDHEHERYARRREGFV